MCCTGLEYCSFTEKKTKTLIVHKYIFVLFVQFSKCLSLVNCTNSWGFFCHTSMEFKNTHKNTLNASTVLVDYTIHQCQQHHCWDFECVIFRAASFQSIRWLIRHQRNNILVEQSIFMISAESLNHHNFTRLPQIYEALDFPLLCTGTKRLKTN